MSSLDDLLRPSSGSLLDNVSDGLILFAISAAVICGLPLLLLLVIAQQHPHQPLDVVRLPGGVHLP